MTDDMMAKFKAALRNDPELAKRLSATQGPKEFDRLAAAAGFLVSAKEFFGNPSNRELTDAELEGVSGGYTFPPTDWVYCDNPWTNEWCTLKC